MAEPLDENDDLPGDEPKPVAKKTPPQQSQQQPTQQQNPKEPEPAPKRHTHSRRLVEVATALGFTQEDLDTFPSEVIWEEVHNLQALAARQQSQQPTVDPARKPAPEMEEFDIDAFVDPKLAGYFKQQAAEIKALKEQNKKLEALEQAEQQRAARARDDMIDAAFTALGKRYEQLVGADAFADLTNPGQKGWRVEIVRAAKLDFSKDTARTVARKIAAAAAVVAKDHVPADEPGPQSGYEAAVQTSKRRNPASGRFTADDFERGQVARPSARKAGVAEVNGAEALHRYLKEQGDPRGDRGYVDPEDDSDLPG